MPILSTAYDQAIRSAWGRFWRLWKPIAGWTLLVWAAITVLLAPLSSAFIGRRLLRGEDAVVGNEALLPWVMSPGGLAYLVLAGAIAISATVLRFAGIFRIVTDDLEGHRASVRRTAFLLAPELPRLLRLCAAAVAAGLALALPLGLAAAAIHALLLARHDINYYLAVQPPEWHLGLLLMAASAISWLFGAAYAVARLLLALPAYLDGHRPLSAAIRRAAGVARGRTLRLIRLFVFIVAGWLLTRALVGAAYLAAASRAVEWVARASDSLTPLLWATAAYLGGVVVLDAAIAFIGFSFLATVVTKVYYEETDLHAEAPPRPRIRELPLHAAARLLLWLSPRRLALAAALLLALGVAAGRLLLPAPADPGAVEVHAHRAGPAPAPENTLAALERAIAAGADYSEIDVQRTRDGVVVVVHDADLMRVARDPRRIAASRYPQLSGVVQLPDDGSPPRERRLATLGEFLDRARGRIGLNVELKYYGWDPELVPSVLREVRVRGMENEIVLMSLDLRAVRQVRRLAPDLRVGYVITAAVGRLVDLPVDFLAVGQPLATPDFLRAAHHNGLHVYAWTVNSPAAMADLVERGVDGLITDDPALAARVRSELRALSPAARLLLRIRGIEMLDIGN